MKKSLLALAVLGAFAGAASAQSSVTLFGTVDVGGQYLKNSGPPAQLSEETDGVNSSEVRFQGVEDLGGGLKAGFNSADRPQPRHRHLEREVLESSLDRQPLQQRRRTAPRP